MSALVERLGAPVRAVARQLEDDLAARGKDIAWAQAPRLGGLGYSLSAADVGRRGAWWLLGQWLCGYALGAIGPDGTLRDAEEWFSGGGGDTHRRRLAPDGVTVPLNASPEEAWALLPYLLDPAGQGTRRQVLGSEAHRPDREHRKKNGVYYTPADVAHYMAGAALAQGARAVLDPACGSAVFLRASVMVNPEVRAFGVDIDPLAVEMAAFVLLASAGQETPTPWACWQQHRMRLAVADALTLTLDDDSDELTIRARQADFNRAKSALADGIVDPPVEAQGPPRDLARLFPELRSGAEAVLNNPPYAALGPRLDFGDLAGRFASYTGAPPSTTSNLFLPFVEMGWRLAHEGGSAAFIVPLSLAYRGGRQFTNLRSAMLRSGGSWDFAFFDRTPDAVFGDDVKTRAAIAIRRPAQGDARVSVTGLLRWTSGTRSQLWQSIDPVVAPSDIRILIPKLSSSEESELYAAVRSLPGRLGDDVETSAAVVVSPNLLADWRNAVLVAPTAYNWLSCARDPAAFCQYGHDSVSPLTALRFATAELADAAYAVLACRLTYWLWRVEGDAFHVQRGFLSDLPFNLGTLDSEKLAVLADAGSELWQGTLAEPVLATNKGKRTVGFCASTNPAAVHRAQSAVAAAFGLESEVTTAALDDWYRALVVVDETDARRTTMLRETAAC